MKKCLTLDNSFAIKFFQNKISRSFNVYHRIAMNIVKHLKWSLLQKYLTAIGC